MIKAIETKYKGCKFRSRLEARWAVFFDALGIKWEYEKEGFDLGAAGWYLPDFWITDEDGEQYWIEIKAHRNLSEREWAVAVELSHHRPGFILVGTPELPAYNGPVWFEATMAVLEIPWELYGGSWAISLGITEYRSKDLPHDIQDRRLCCWHERNDGTFTLWPVPSFEPSLLPGGVQAWLNKKRLDYEDLVLGNPLVAGVKSIRNERLSEAYTAARSARFETR